MNSISIVIPVFDEEENASDIFRERDYACIDKARKSLGHSDLVPYREGFSRTVCWFSKHSDEFLK